MSCRDTCLVAPINDGADAELKLRHVKSAFVHPSTGVSDGQLAPVSTYEVHLI